MFLALARLARRRPWWIVGAWTAIFAASAVVAPRLVDRLLAGGFDIGDSESGLSSADLAREIGISGTDVAVMLRSDSAKTVDSPEFLGAIARTVDALAEVEGVTRVSTPESSGDPTRISADRRAIVLTAHLPDNLDDAQRIFPAIPRAIPDPPEGVQVFVSGIPAVYTEMNEISERDLHRAEGYALPIALAILLVVFRSPIAAGLPILLGVVCMTTNLAVLYGVTHVRPLGIFVLNVTTAVGLGVAIDYSLLVVSRFREELANGAPVDLAIDRTVTTAGKAIFFSGLAVVVSLVGLWFVRFVAIHSIGIGGMIVVAISVAAALTLLPAILVLLGPRIDWLSLWKRPRSRDGRLWGRLARVVMRRPVPVFAGILVLVLVLMSPVRGIQLGVPAADMLPPGSRTRVATDETNRTFPDRRLPQIVVTFQDEAGIRRPERIGQIREFVRWLERQEGVTDVLSYVNFVPKGLVPLLQMQRAAPSEDALYDSILTAPPGTLPAVLSGPIRNLSSETLALVRVYTAGSSNSRRVHELVGELRSREWPAGLSVRVGGECGGFIDFTKALYDDFARAMIVVVALTYAILVLQFGSFVLPAKAVVMNALSIGAAYGAIVFVFQEGHLADLLGFSPLGYIDAPGPIVIFSVLFGLSMDYEVFMLSRVKEAYDRGLTNAESVAEGLTRTGGIITSASAIMIAVAGSFAFADIYLVKTLGFGMAFAIFLDATVIRAFLVPSTMRLMGDWNWWAPRFARPFLDKVSRFTAHG